MNSHIWNKNITFKVSFLLWRALILKLPTNDKLVAFGLDPVKYVCCIRVEPDHIEHIFFTRWFASHIWKYFSSFIGITYSHTSLNNLLIFWWQRRAKNMIQKILIQSLPIFIGRNLSKNRCSAKYSGEKSNSARVEFLICRDIFHLLITAFPYLSWPSSHNECINMIDSCSQEKRIVSVIWKTPPNVVLKLNTNGSALNNPWRIGGWNP